MVFRAASDGRSSGSAVPTLLSRTLLTVMLAVAAGGFHPTGVAAQAPAEGATGSRSTRIELSPSPLALRCGEAADLSITASDVAALWGVDFQLAYDPALLEVVDEEGAAQGQPLISEVFSGSQAMIALNGVDPVAGVASFAAVLLRPAAPLQGEVEVARVRLRGRAAGAGEILMLAATLADPQARPIPVTTSPVLFEVLCPSASAGEGAGEDVSARESPVNATTATSLPGQAVSTHAALTDTPATSEARSATADPDREGPSSARASAPAGTGAVRATKVGPTRPPVDQAASVVKTAPSQSAADGGETGDADADSLVVPGRDAVERSDGVDEDGQARRVDGGQGENVEAEEDEQAQMMLYLVIGMLAAVSAGVAGIAGAIAVARRMVPLAPEEKSPDEKPGRDE